MPIGTKIPYKNIPPAKTFGFGWIGLRKNMSLGPMAVFISIGAGMAVIYSGYALYQKSDVIVSKNKDLPPWERVNPTESQKIISVRQNWEANKELENLKKEMGN